ncbi:MAG: endo-1,4-beta-xylanase [Acidobacteriaceae bacterium]
MSVTRREFLGRGVAVGAVGFLGLRGVALAGTHADSIRAAGASRGILAGCAVNVAALRKDPAYRALLKAQVGIVVAEASFKFGPLRPTPTTFFFDDADYLASFAEENGMKLRGHNFVWHRQLPKWFDSYVTPANAKQVLVEHIERVGGRYKGKIQSWDVVNEAIQISDGLPGGFRNSPWQKMLGGTGLLPEYLVVAYRTARRVDPKALLVYNDYGIEGEDEGSEKKRVAVMGLLREMQRRGVPVDALGVQSHITAVNKDGSVPVYGDGLRKMIAEARGMGLKVLVTEMDVNDRYVGPAIGVRDAAVAKMYGSYLKTVLADESVIAVLTWGITDKYTWLDREDARADGVPERPLPFDAEMQPVAAFAAEVGALRDAPARA